METLIPLLIQLLSGAVGGNIAGAALKNVSLGAMGNTLAGVVGGVLGGQFLNTATLSELGGFAGDIISGGVGGGVLMIAIGLLRKVMTE